MHSSPERFSHLVATLVPAALLLAAECRQVLCPFALHKRHAVCPACVRAHYLAFIAIFAWDVTLWKEAGAD